MRIIVLDDNQNDCNLIKQLVLSNLDEDSEGIIYTFSTISKFQSFIQEYTPDILFLDIELGEMNGIELAKDLKKIFPQLIIIYVTNHPQHVFNCFETEPLDFIRKPIIPKHFNDIFKRAIKKYTELHKTIPIKWQNESVNLEIKDICYVEGYNRHLVFKLYNGDSYEVVGKINVLYEKLKIHGFVKTHQGFIVNMFYIKEFDENDILMKNGDKVLMSFRRRLKTKMAYTNYINRR